MESCRRVGVNVDFPSSKLRPGFGIFVTSLLNSLADSAMESRKHKWMAPLYPEEQVCGTTLFLYLKIIIKYTLFKDELENASIS